MLVLHYTGMSSAQAALDHLRDPLAKVSAHYVIDEDGTVYRLVEERYRAWHAGVSFWQGASHLNNRSIGIELVNPGHKLGYHPFPAAQMQALECLATGILQRYPISARRVLGHADIAPQRRQDPGEFLDWARLARAGIGLWPQEPLADPVSTPPDLTKAKSMLARFGYAVPLTSGMDQETQQVITAFQRHFRPARVDGNLDEDTWTHLKQLIELVD